MTPASHFTGNIPDEKLVVELRAHNRHFPAREIGEFSLVKLLERLVSPLSLSVDRKGVSAVAVAGTGDR